MNQCGCQLADFSGTNYYLVCELCRVECERFGKSLAALVAERSDEAPDIPHNNGTACNSNGTAE